MSTTSADATTGAPERISNFGNSLVSVSTRLTVGTNDEWERAVRRAGPRGLTVRGAGLSYSDAALNSAGLVVSASPSRGIGPVHVTPSPGTPAAWVDVGAGVTLREVLRTVVPQGWILPVLPGTALVTVGGAIAADAHGKNHDSRGSFGTHVGRLVLRAPVGGELVIGPDHDPAAFWATVGGLGLTGLIIDARLDLEPISSGLVIVDETVCGSLDAVLHRLLVAQRAGVHSVAWLDGHARGTAVGRGVVTVAHHALFDELSAADRLRPPAYQSRAWPGRWPLSVNLVRPSVVRTANATRYARARSGIKPGTRSIASVLHPLDSIASWPTAYGSAGFVQYQLAVPDGREDLLGAVLAALSTVGCPPSLAVLKRFGAASPAPLSFPLPGWTLALDLPAAAGRRARGALDALDTRVAGAGGRLYLVKDSRMRRDLPGAMYPRLDEWRATRDRLDPDGVLTSDLDRRLGLTGRSR
ncbi:FAD-binding protein [Cellulomonas sp. P5_C6]